MLYKEYSDRWITVTVKINVKKFISRLIKILEEVRRTNGWYAHDPHR